MDITNSKHLMNAGLIVDANAATNPDAPLSTLTNHPYIGFSVGNDGREGEIATFLREFFTYCDGLFLSQFVDQYIDQADIGVNSRPEQLLRFLVSNESEFEFLTFQTGNSAKPAYVVSHRELTKQLRSMRFENREDYEWTENNLLEIAKLVNYFDTFVKTRVSEELYDLMKAQRFIALSMAKHF